MKQLTCGSLFAGIGGFDLGFERAGIKTIWQVEIDEYCRRVLAKHFPEAERFGDIRECGAHNLARVDIVCGGFPCQDVSQAQTCNERSIDGRRSGLWSEFHRIIRELRPGFVVVENVAGLLNRGIDRVLGDLAEIGYDAEWDSIPACSVGAPHIRERIWILAYPTGVGLVRCDRRNESEGDSYEGERWGEAKRRQDRKLAPLVPGICDGADADWWRAQSRVARSTDGIPNWMDRVKSTGNAVVPQIAEWIGRRIIEAEQMRGGI